MATKLTKDLTRESTEVIDGKEIIVTLTEDQEIELKIKGQRGKGKTIYIKELYADLNGIDLNETKDKNKEGSLTIKAADRTKKRGDDMMISLYDLRSQNAISTLDLDTLAKFDQIIKNVIDSYKGR